MGTQQITPVISYLRKAAQRWPERPALVAPQCVNYRQLYGRVQRWASVYQRHGVEAGERVAIWLPKCPEYLTALYAAMESGGVYVPLDGMQPAERACRILESAQPSILVTDIRRLTELDDRLPSSLTLIVVVDGEAEAEVPVPVQTLSSADLDSEHATALPHRPAPDDLAAILFTSGSTGTPKGVQVSYRNLDSFINWALDEFSLSEQDVFASHAGFHFDLSTFDYFAAAAVGAGVWMVREPEQRNVGVLLEGIRHHGVTVWYSVPSVLALLAATEQLTLSITRTLRYVLFAGEPFPIGALRQLRASLPGKCELYNLYGPTETNVCLYHRVCEEDLNRIRPVSIGRPLPGVSATIENEKGEPVTQEGRIGELIISGPCVTPGYWRREDPDNAGNHRRNRHATGDLVSVENGLIEYHGRRDRMVKIQGNRVEMGEIEAVLSAMAGVGDVAVVVDRYDGAPQLVVFHTVEEGQSVGALAVRQYCARHLPRYMIPRRILQLETMPRNANGKVDYRRLEQQLAEQHSRHQPSSAVQPLEQDSAHV